MGTYLITFYSMTAAEAGLAALRGAGVAADLTQPPAAAAARGCGYALRTETLQGAAGQLRKAGVRYGRLYRVTERGNVMEVLL